MSAGESARFCLGLSVLIAMVAGAFFAIWFVMNLWVQGVLPADGAWLVIVLLLAVSVALALRSYMHTLSEDRKRRRIDALLAEEDGDDDDDLPHD